MKDETRVTLIERVRSGKDQTAWQEFTGIYGNYLYLIVRGLGIAEDDADDVVQDCLLSIWKAMPNFEYGKNGATFRTWAATIARRTVIDHRRKLGRRIKTDSLEDNDSFVDPGNDNDPEFIAFVDKEWRTYVVNLAFERIRPHFSGKAIGVFEAALAGKSPAAIAEQFDLQQDSIRKLRSRVARRLEQEIQHLRNELD